MHFKKKILLSLVTIAVLSSCATEDKYKADTCVGCSPTASENENNGSNPNPNLGQENELSISFTHNDGNVSWQKKHEHEQVQGMVLTTGLALVYTKWDNSLIVIDPSTKTTSDNKEYLYVEGGRYSSGEIPVVDDVSGASEQILQKMLSDESGSSIYSMLLKYDDSSKDIGIGIYSDAMGNGVPSTKFARRNSSATNYYNYPKIRDIALSHNATQLVAVGDDRKIKIFDANNLNSPSEIDTGRKMRSVDFSLDDEHIFTGSGGLSSHIRIYNLASKNKVAEIETEETPIGIIQVPDAQKIIVLFNDSNKVRIYDISDISKPIESKLLITNGKAKSISISADKKTFAVTATGKQVNLFSLDGGDSPTIIKHSEECFSTSFMSDSKLLVIGRTSMEFFDITISKK